MEIFMIKTFLETRGLQIDFDDIKSVKIFETLDSLALIDLFLELDKQCMKDFSFDEFISCITFSDLFQLLNLQQS